MKFSKTLLAAFVISCCGCALPLPDINLTRKVSKAELVGTWVLTAQAKKMIAAEQTASKKPPTGYIKLLADGSCEFSSIYSVNYSLVHLESKGKWVLEHDTTGDSNYKKKNALRLDMESSQFASNTYLNFTQDNGKLLLWSFYGDPDSFDLIEYHKQKESKDK